MAAPIAQHVSRNCHKILSFNRISLYKYNLICRFYSNLKDANPIRQPAFESSTIKLSQIIPDRLLELDNALNDKRFRSISVAFKSRKMREKKEIAFLDGSSLITKAVAAGIKINELYFSKLSDLKDLPLDKLIGDETKFCKIPEMQLKQLSELSMIGVSNIPCNIPCNLGVQQKTEGSIPLTLICDNIRDPGNMGTILMSSAAVSCSQILIAKGCVDVWNPKVVRGSNGAHFVSNISTDMTWKDIEDRLPSESRIYLADCSERTVQSDVNLPFQDYSSVDYTVGQSALLISGETEGLSSNAVAACSRWAGSCRVHIPMWKDVDSLNSAIAGSVIMFEIARQLRTKL